MKTPRRAGASPVPGVDVIPTPREVTPLPSAGRTWRRGALWTLAVAGTAGERGRFAVEFLAARLRAEFGLRLRVTPFSPERAATADVILCGDGDRRVAALLPADLAALGGPAAEQGYALRCAAGAPVTLFARAPAGLLYAAATLLQLLRREKDSLRLPGVAVRDWPEFRLRGNSWMLRAEIDGWSYARGDGLRAYERRVLRKLDLCALYKINFLYFDGFSWNLGRFPGRDAMMRRLNRAAALRGVRLSFGGYGAVGGGLENRRRYPDGAPYACIGQPGHPERTRGTCLSNRALVRMRAERLAAFVRRVRPGALYLHGIDTGTVADSAPIWAQRCPACRRRWPNDAIAAPDGMAGAYAAFYDAMASAVRRVDPDCLLNAVSPCYTGRDENDAQWAQAVRYWVTVSRCLKDRGIQFGFREQFAGDTGAGPRYAEMRRQLDREAKGHRISSLHFYGGDCFYNSHPFLATPVVSRYFRGADLVVHGNGHAYEEPQQLFSAECLWNPEGSRYFTPPPLEPYKAFYRRYLDLSSGTHRPAGVWGAGGFLDTACARLHGPQAGPLVARLHRLRTTARLGSPGIMRLERFPVWMPVYNYLHPARKSFIHAGLAWRAQGPNAKRARRLEAVYSDVARLNRRGATLARRAARLCNGPQAAADLDWMAVTLEAAGRCAELLAPFVGLFLRAHAAAATGRGRARALREVAAFRRRVDALDRAMLRALPPGPDLPDDVELQTRRRAAETLRRLLDAMGHTLTTGEWSARA
jgi:hypothetical protein